MLSPGQIEARKARGVIVLETDAPNKVARAGFGEEFVTDIHKLLTKRTNGELGVACAGRRC